MAIFSIITTENVDEVVQGYINEEFTQLTIVKDEYGNYVVRAL